MSEAELSVVGMIQESLHRIEHRQDTQAAQLAAIDRRLTAIEIKVQDIADMRERLEVLEAEKNKAIGAKTFAVGIISAAISAAGIYFGIK